MNYKNYFKQRLINEMSMSEIADRMNYSNADTVKAKKYKCKKRLDVLIKKKYTQEDFFN